MIDGWVLWLVLLGLATGVVMAWVLLVRLPRRESDVSALERRAEADWISATIERHGGVAPVSLVDEVLELHQAYLGDPRMAQEPAGRHDPPPSPVLTAPPGSAQPQRPLPPMPQAGPPPRAPMPPLVPGSPIGRGARPPRPVDPGPPTRPR